MTFSMTGQESGDLLIQVTTLAGVTVIQQCKQYITNTCVCC